MERHVAATPAALQMIERLAREHGPLAFFQSGGCCDGSLPLCLTAAEMPAGPHDVKLGELEGMPFYVDGEQYRRWGEPSFVIDLSPGASEGFSLAPSTDEHFVSRSPGADSDA
jgi:uncharacterized protein (DUF779 family)